MAFAAGRWPDLSNRRTILAICAAGVAVTILGLAYLVGTSNFRMLLMLAVLVLGLPVLLVAVRFPYALALGLYCVVVPFDQVLRIPGAGSVTRYIGFAVALCVAVYAMRMRRIHRPPLALYLWFAYFGWLVIGVFRTVDMDNGMATLQAMSSMILLYGILSVAPTAERQLRFTCTATVAGGVVAALYGIVLFHQNPAALASTDSRITVQLLGNTLDANLYADALIAPFALALLALLRARSPRTLLVSFGATAVILTAIVASLSREALLAVAVVIGVTIWFSRRRLLGIVLAVPALAGVLLAPPILSRIVDGFQTGGAGRVSIWRVDWTAFLQHPLFGWGTGNSIEAYDRNFLSVFQAYNAGWARPPHNTTLFIAVELGIVGVVLFYAAWFAAFRPLARVPRGDSLYDLRVAISAALLALLVAGCFIDVSATRFLWLVLVLAAQFRTVSISRAQPPPPAIVYDPPSRTLERPGSRARTPLRDGSPA